jgi:hypothetical protein
MKFVLQITKYIRIKKNITLEPVIHLNKTLKCNLQMVLQGNNIVRHNTGRPYHNSTDRSLFICMRAAGYKLSI